MLQRIRQGQFPHIEVHGAALCCCTQAALSGSNIRCTLITVHSGLH